MQITKDTPITLLDFPHAWRLRKAVSNFNATVDKKSRLVTVNDLINKKNNLIPLLGIGPKTFQYLFDYLTEKGL